MKRRDKTLFIVTIILFIIGLIMILSASSYMTFFRGGKNVHSLFGKQAFHIFLGFIVSTFMLKLIPTDKYYDVFKYLITITIMLLIYIFLFEERVNGRQSWFGRSLGLPVALQVSEIAKPILIVWVAAYYQKFIDKIKVSNAIESYVPIVIAVIVVALIVIQPDLGTSLITTSIFAFMFLASPVSVDAKKKSVLIFSLLGIVGILVLGKMGLSDTIGEDKVARLHYKNVCYKENFEKYGNQLCNGYIAINNGGLLGVGLSKSTQKYLYLPEPHNDFIITIVLEELGLVGASVIFILYFILLSRIFVIASKAHNIQNRLIANGIGVYILLHIIINLYGVLGVIPLTGVPLPFLSYGGSFALSLIISLSIVQRIHIENQRSRGTISKRKVKRK